MHPKELLAVRWRRLSKVDLETHLRFLILAEHHAHPAYKYFDSEVSALRLRATRLAVAKHFVAHGGAVSRRLTSAALPPPRKWPGVVRLIKTAQFELFESEVSGPVA
jgi:hypothetical protein